MTDRIGAISREIIRQHNEGARYRNLGGALEPRDMAEAYAAQFRLHKEHAEGGFSGARGVLGGRKIALASAVQQKLCGVDHPIAGGIFASEIHQSPATIRLADYHGLGMEFELACVMAEDIRPGDGPFTAASIRAKTASIHPAFEMIIDRGADYAQLDARTMAADNAWCAGIVLGPAIDGWREMNVAALPVALHWNDEPVAKAKAGDADPFGSLAWVAGVLTEAGQTIRAGEVVITGSVIKTRAPLVGDQIRYQVGDSAEVSVRIT
jgi:2-keto-4-pentenoate hydratase